MADKNLLTQMLEHLVNGDQQKADELFHEYVVQQSREIYETLIESEISDEDVAEASMEDEEEDDLEEAAEEESDDEEEDLDENFEDIAYEGDDEGGDEMTGDLGGDLDMGPEEGEAEEKSEEELFQDLDAIVDELQAKFDELKGMETGEHEMDGDTGEEEMGGEDDEMESMGLATVREYVEKVPAGHGAEKKGGAEQGGTNTKSIIDNMKNDMGGTTANILSGRNGADAGSVGAGGKIKGSALSDQNPEEDNAGNINVPGGKAGNAFSKKEPGHGAEKKGAAEQADNKQSLFRGRR